MSGYVPLFFPDTKFWGGLLSVLGLFPELLSLLIFSKNQVLHDSFIVYYLLY